MNPSAEVPLVTRKTKVLLGAGVAGVLVVVGWAIRPLKTAETRREGDFLVTVTKSRSYRWLSPSEWGFGTSSVVTNMTWYDTTRLGVVAVQDYRDQARVYLPPE